MATRITQSLLAAWLYSYKTDNGYDDFLATLNREKQPPTEAMLNGIEFESLVNSALDGTPPPADHKWRECVEWCADYLKGAQKQVLLTKPLVVDGEELLLVGVLDFLRAGVVYDTKFSKTYQYGRYLRSPQTSAYFSLCDGDAKRFEYIISDGNYVYRESYTPDEVEPIENTIHNFLQFLRRYNLYETYKEKWRVTE